MERIKKMQIRIGNHFFFTRKRPTRKQLEAALRVKDDIISRLYKEIELRGRNVCPECGKKINCDRLKYWRDLNDKDN